MYWKIILPLAMPVLAIIFLLSFISAQAEFLIASVILFGQDISSPSKTVATGLQGSWPATATTCGGGRSPPAR